MKVLRNVVVGLFVIGLIGSMPAASLAQAKEDMKGTEKSTAPGMHEHKVWNEADKKNDERSKRELYNEAASALQQTNPALSAELTKLANEERLKLARSREERKEMEGAARKERAEMGARIKVLRDAAAALQPTNPALAERLTKKADHMAKKMEMKKEENEGAKKEEAEKTEQKW